MNIKCLAVLLAVGFAACSEPGTAADTSPESLQTARVNYGEVTRIINASGTVQPETTVLVGSEVSGRILAVNVDFNSPVKTGDVLAVIDPQTFQNQVLQLEANALRDRSSIKTSQANIERAEVNLKQNEQILSRRGDLYEQNATSLAQLEEAERSVGVSRADLAVSRAQLEGARASLAQTEASLETARFNLSRTNIQSPIDGVVIERQIDPGQTVQSSFSAPELFKIAADLSEIEVEAAIVESDVGGLTPGDRVEFTVDAYPNKPFIGTVQQLRLNSEVLNNIVTYVAIVKAANDDGLLLPGMTANLQITTETKQDVLRVSANTERFRPSPEFIEKWRADGAEETEEASPTEAVYTRLAQIGAEARLIGSVRDELETIAEPILAIINDPQLSFRHTRALQRLTRATQLALETNLSGRQLQAYNALVAEESSVRSTMLWVKTTEGKMVARATKLGLSDGSSVEIISGLEDGDEVVTGAGASGPGRAAPRRGVGGRSRGAR